MSILKRGNIWWAIFTTPGGRRIRKSLGTSDKKDAQRLHDEWRREQWKLDQLEERPDRTWDEAAVKWLEQAEANGKASLLDDEGKIAWFTQHLKGMRLKQINESVIDFLVQEKRKDKARGGNAVQNSTINRHLALLRAILRKAHLEWKWIDKVPTIKLFSEPKRRVRSITPEQVQLLLQQLPEHQQEMTMFALSTGLRQSNVKNLEWSQLDFGRRVMWVHADQSKSGEAMGLPLNETAIDVLMRQKGKHPTRVFTFRGKPVTQVNTYAWRQGLKNAGIENFRWHDLRHTWATWLRMKGVPLSEIQDLGGWASEKMVKRYAHTDTQHLRSYAVEIDSMFGTNLTQSPEESNVSN